jgi:hypothetical protein
MDWKLVGLIAPEVDKARITTPSFWCKSRHPTDL